MLIRELLEQEEEKRLSQFAQLSSKSKGRKYPEEGCPIRTAFQRDRDKVIHSKSFRLLKQKTQVFLSTTGEEFRTRLTHVLEVGQVARTICRALNLNEDLAEAIALGHDLGHTPFGHIGEEILNELCPEGFHHSRQSLRIVEVLEKGGKGLNLTWEVRDGIVHHAKGQMSIERYWMERAEDVSTLEGKVTQCADWIAYICHDLDDALNMGIIGNSDLPSKAEKVLGRRHSQRMNTMICDLVEHSKEGRILMGKEVLMATEELRSFLYEKVYTHQVIRGKDKEIQETLEGLFSYYLDHPDIILKEMPWLKEERPARIVCDYVALLTDRQAQEEYKKIKVKC